MNVSLRELVVLIRRVLFSLRIPTHATMAASRLITQLEIRESRGLKGLEELVALNPDWGVRSRSVSHHEKQTCIDAAGDNVLLLGPSLLDLACAQAKRDGDGVVLAQSITMLPFAAVLEELGARRGFSTLVVMAHSDSLHSMIADFVETPSSMIHGVVCSSSVSGEGLPNETSEPVDALRFVHDWLTLPDYRGADLERRAMTNWPAIDEPGDLLIVCKWQAVLSPKPLEPDWVVERGFEWVVIGPSEFGAATWWEREAVNRGVEVCASRWARLEEQVFRGLAPMSDRSRLDAGAVKSD